MKIKIKVYCTSEKVLLTPAEDSNLSVLKNRLCTVVVIDNYIIVPLLECVIAVSSLSGHQGAKSSDSIGITF